MTGDTWAILIALAGGLLAFWKALSNQMTDMSKRFGDRSGRMEKRLGDRGDRMEKRFKETSDADRLRIREIVSEIREDIKKIFRRLPRQPIESQSPLRLTDYGRALSEGIAGAKWASRIADTIGDQVEGMEAFEIQEFSFAYVEEKLKPSEDERASAWKSSSERASPEWKPG